MRQEGHPGREAVQGLAVLGATGSIGISTLKVAELHPGRFRVVALSAYERAEELRALCQTWRPALAAIHAPETAHWLAQSLADTGTEVLAGPTALERIVCDPRVTTVVCGIVGAAGLKSAWAAVAAGKRVLFANKEPLVMSGHLLMALARQSGAQLLPLDSEHNAVFQCLPQPRAGLAGAGVRRIVLTCSGGPFRNTPASEFATITPEQACAHPRWSMGRKISVDSATLMNKGLELIEACRLFEAAPAQIDVVIHPQSIIHSLVEYVDGSTLAQLGNPDMRTPIAHALAFPDRIEAGVTRLDLAAVGRLDFEVPDEDRFPCLRLARAAAVAGASAPTVLNAANEIAVEAFLARELPFAAIPQVIESVLEARPVVPAESIEAILEEDRMARECAHRVIGGHRAKGVVAC
ncbi:1-deoxy-D-xylulose-5-phosphate reductoisomerase [Acidiferrobacter thiooxydans]|uniref:1-deoxy-D-xylulose 5-phosphate reductoisomerase n=1 Tax=Acidiferrobacter thiooxydans TaxID=163359 RepID=A0A1C2FXT6_9GAMM|nr:1-deoxy-D-xylulose-5-phosphate reductoisomerase [Acidiferrobacter thiooxydans]RCN59210.1 1-deoxy-D-xylulose-5-phosphate reductoisomerase [Acidiferrobacter thiooxydans]UEO00943.1 1-deoxy-D-xylulose-5-phosphate reductoisomerase [Acidiferrobacter thiooxydans]